MLLGGSLVVTGGRCHSGRHQAKAEAWMSKKAPLMVHTSCSVTWSLSHLFYKMGLRTGDRSDGIRFGKCRHFKNENWRNRYDLPKGKMQLWRVDESPDSSVKHSVKIQSLFEEVKSIWKTDLLKR